MEPWQVDSMLLALHNIAISLGVIAATGTLAFLAWALSPRGKD